MTLPNGPATGRLTGEVPPDEELEALEPNTLIIENAALRKGFTLIPNYILRDPSVTFGAKLTYTLLLSYAWQAGSCFPGQVRIARDLGVSRKAVNTYLRELKDRGFIAWTRRGLGKTNVYRILDYKPNSEADVTPRLHPDVTTSSHQDITPRLHKEYTVQKNSDNKGVDADTQTGEKEAVVTTLTQYGIALQKARELASKFTPPYIHEKIELLEWNREQKKAGRPIQNRAAWLLKAIESNFPIPEAMTTKAQRARDEAERKEQLTQALAEQEADQKQRQETEAKQERQRRRELRKKYGTGERERSVWRQVLSDLASSTSPAIYTTWMQPSELLRLEAGTALIGVANQAAKEWLSGRLQNVITRAFSSCGVTVDELIFEVISSPPAGNGGGGKRSRKPKEASEMPQKATGDGFGSFDTAKSPKGP